MLEFLDYLPSLETAKYSITLLAKANSVDPTLALVVVGCAVTLILAILIQWIAKVVLFVSTGLKWICYAIGLILLGFVVILVTHRIWMLAEVVSMRCTLVDQLRGIEEGGEGWMKVGASLLGSWVKMSGGLSGGWFC